MARKRQKAAKKRAAVKKPARKRAAKAKRVKKAAPEEIPKNLMPTGITGLDRLLGGGIPEGSAILLHGTPHTGKKPLLMKLMYTSLKRRQPVVTVLTDVGVVNWQKVMEEGGWPLDRFRDISFFVDSYSQQFGQCPNTDTITCIEVPFSLSGLSIETTNFLEQTSRKSRKKPIIILHSLSTLIQNFGQMAVLNFIQFFMGKMKAEGITVIVSLVSEQDDGEFAGKISGLVDGIIQMRDSKIKASGFMNLKSREWVSYSIGKGGVKVEF